MQTMGVFMMMFAISDDIRADLLIAAALGIFVLLWFLGAMFRREAVKRDLYQRGCKPIHIRWSPMAYWVPGWYDTVGFRVVYSDPSGFVHKAYCYVTLPWFATVLEAHRVVKWLKDEVTGQLPSPEVWSDGEIIRPKLKERGISTEANNLLENPDEPPD